MTKTVRLDEDGARLLKAAQAKLAKVWGQDEVSEGDAIRMALDALVAEVPDRLVLLLRRDDLSE